MKKSLTPSQLAELNKKAKYSMSLSKTSMDKIKALAEKDDIPYSNIVDHAISEYLKTLK